VWLSTPDGARQFQVARGGGYMDASQADDGTIIALHDFDLPRLDRQGTVLADFTTPVGDGREPALRQFRGPFQPRSPRTARSSPTRSSTPRPARLPIACRPSA
jgi:hypothetical protein